MERSECKSALCACFINHGTGVPTFWFHHHARRVPCIIQVSAPRSAIVDRYVWMSAAKCGIVSSSGRGPSANLWNRQTNVRVGGLQTSSPSVIVIMEAARSVSNFEEENRVQFKTYSDSSNDALALCRRKRNIYTSSCNKRKRHGNTPRRDTY